MTGHVQDTEDLVQETFLRALKRWESYTPGTNLRAWLLRIACNAFVDGRRKKNRRRHEPLTVEPGDREPGVEQGFETAEQAALARAALDGLTDLTRAVFHLRVQEDLSFRDIAEVLGTTEESARWHMHHARTVLQKRLRDTR
jgi:RNA polymerase sigma-70 factor (ECF subfamily)